MAMDFIKNSFIYDGTPIPEEFQDTIGTWENRMF